MGHDCGHRSFSENKLVEDIVGTLMFMPLVYPFEPWRIKHNQHHAQTNKCVPWLAVQWLACAPACLPAHPCPQDCLPALRTTLPQLRAAAAAVAAVCSFNPCHPGAHPTHLLTLPPSLRPPLQAGGGHGMAPRDAQRARQVEPHPAEDLRDLPGQPAQAVGERGPLVDLAL